MYLRRYLPKNILTVPRLTRYTLSGIDTTPYHLTKTGTSYWLLLLLLPLLRLLYVKVLVLSSLRTSFTERLCRLGSWGWLYEDVRWNRKDGAVSQTLLVDNKQLSSMPDVV